MTQDTTVAAIDSNDSMDEAVLFAKKYLEDMLSFFGLNTEVHASSDEEVIQLDVPSTHMNGFLIGQNGENIRSLQYLNSMALKNGNFTHARVNVDVADYKKQRADRLREKAEGWIATIKETGNSKKLEPMNAADRRVVHQLAADLGVVSESAGQGRDRYIVLKLVAVEPETTEHTDSAD